MKIGILTFHNALNVGAVLQAYALQVSLIEMGHEVEFINYQRKIHFTAKQVFARSIRQTIIKMKNFYYGYKYRRNNSFNKVLNISDKVYHNINELRNCPPEYEVYIAGSDQIWNLGSQSYINKIYYLDFGSSQIKRIAFAASLGQCIIPKRLESQLVQLLSKFNKLSVRETSSVLFLNSLLKGIMHVEHINDPTFLLNKSQFLNIADPLDVKSDFIASYILASYTKDNFKAIDYIKERLGLKLLNLRNPDTCIVLPKTKNVIVTPLMWLSYFNAATFTICCSFHAVVFSLIFHKPFIVITPYENQRIESLLSQLKLEYRIVTEFDSQIIDRILFARIDWEVINAELEKIKFTSKQFLLDSLI